MSDEPALEHPDQEDARPPSRTWRILFLDCEANIERLKEACRGAGYVVIGATTTGSAHAFLDGKNHADVIVCAAHLQDESMFAFLADVRNSTLHHDTIVVILSLEPSATSARLDRSTRNAAILLGANAYLEMPEFDPAELIAQLRRLRPAIPALQRATDQDTAQQNRDEDRRRKAPDRR